MTRRLVLSCSKDSFMPKSLAPPQPKQRFSGFGLRVMVSIKVALASLSSSDQCDTAALRSADTALALAHLDAQQLGDGGDTAADLLLVEAGKAQAQRVGQRGLHIEVAAGSEEHATLLGMNQQFAGVETRRQFEPKAHAAFGTGPAAVFRHVLAERFIAG